jgi:predicted  nucleic acid-binding Zn-ribbon protein
MLNDLIKRFRNFEMKDLDAKIKSKQDLFDRIANQREYKSAQQEIDALKKKQYDLEETLLEAWNELESLNRGYIETKTKLEKRITELEDLITSCVQRKKELIQKISQRHNERSALESGIPEEWIEKYSAMRAVVSNPVVPVINNACSACFYSVTQQDIARLKKNALLQCKECYRFLYME